MKFTFALTAFLAADVAVASSWFSKAGMAALVAVARRTLNH